MGLAKTEAVESQVSRLGGNMTFSLLGWSLKRGDIQKGQLWL